jgi:hypothetical protein
MKVLFLFLDGVGLGANDSQVNPFAKVEMPHLQALLGGEKLVMDSLSAASPGDRSSGKLETERCFRGDRISLWS